MGTSPTHFTPLPAGVDTVLVTAFALPAQGGIQRSVDQVATALGSRVLVLAPPDPAADDSSRPYRVLRRHIFSGRSRPSWWWFLGWAKKQRAHGLRTIIFGHYSAAALAGPLLRLVGIRYIILTHGRDVLLEQRRWRWLVGMVLRRAEWVGVNSTYVTSLIQALGVPLARIVRTHPAVPDADVATNPSTRSHDLVTVARLVERKNIRQVIRALPGIRESVPDAQYHVIGDGPERPALERLAAEMDVSSVVHFHGQLSDEQRTRILDQSGCFVMTPIVAEGGTDVEGLGLVYLEAAARGLPIVASPTGGVTDIVQPGVTGELVGPDDPQELAQAVVRILQQSNDVTTRIDVVRQEFTWSVRNGRVAAMLNDAHIDIGVVIPAYNSAQQIGRTVRDIFSQTLVPQQVVVVDDGSTDNVAAALAPWRDKITLVSQANQGAAAARNTGAAHITAPYIIFVDADIQLQPRMFERMARVLLTHPESSYAYSSFRFGPKGFHLFDFDAHRLRQTNYIHTTSLIRRADLVPFDPGLKKFQDWDVWLTMLEAGHGGVWVPETLFSVSQAGGTMSSWLPSFMYRLPGIGQGRGNATIARYRAAEQIIRKKHGLSSVAD